jgi:hypothetical protein
MIQVKNKKIFDAYQKKIEKQKKTIKLKKGKLVN